MNYKRYVNEGGYVVPESTSDQDLRAAERFADARASRGLSPEDSDALTRKYESCLNTLRDIVAIGKGKGYELAKHRLAQLGESTDG